MKINYGCEHCVATHAEVLTTLAAHETRLGDLEVLLALSKAADALTSLRDGQSLRTCDGDGCTQELSLRAWATLKFCPACHKEL